MNLDGLEAFNLDGLSRVRDGKPSAREDWRPLRIDDLGFGIVIAFDQTLNATAGMCVHREDEGLKVRGIRMLAGTIPNSFSGDEASLRKGVDLYDQFIEFLMSMRGHHPDEPITVVHEAPAVGGGSIRRPESALLAAQALRIACHRLDIPVAPMVASGAHKRAISGNARADKVEEHRALALLAEAFPIAGYRQVSNEHKRDALCIALTHLARGE